MHTLYILPHLRMPSTLLFLSLLMFHVIRSHSHSMPPPRSNCRRHNAWLPSKSADSQLEAQATKLAKDARRRRVELRRIRSFSQAMSAADPPDSSPNDVEKFDEIVKEVTEGASTDLGGEQLSARRRSYGKISVVGRRREMDDVVAVELGFLKRGEEIYDFFGVFDCREGRRVARACSQMLHQMLAKIVEEETENEIDWEEVMLEGFDEVEARIKKNGAAAGAIAMVVAVVGDNEVVVAAKCDGSKAVLCSGGVAVRLLDDEKANCMNNNREEVQVRVTRRRRADEFLILGSDGFWDVVSDELACQIASAAADGSGGAEAAAALMAEFAVAQGSRDNISVILVDLRGASDDGILTSAAASSNCV